MVSPHRGPVITGKPGIRLAHSSSGFSRSPLPALSRQATSCAWRPRLRRIPDRRSVEARAGGHVRAASATQTAISKNRSKTPRRHWRPGGQTATQEAQRNPTRTRAKRYAQRGLGDTCAPNHTNLCIFCASNRDAEMSPQTGRARRYAQCGFVDMGGLERFMSQHVRRMFCNFAKTTPSDDNIKSMKFIGNIRQN